MIKLEVCYTFDIMVPEEVSKMDRTGQNRVKKQRDARSAEGWAEVRVWVPTRSDAGKVQALAGELRSKAQQLDGIDKLEYVKKMPPDIYLAALKAIMDQGSSAYITPSGAVQTFLSEVARDGFIADFASAFVLFARAYPMNATAVEADVPAKIFNHYWIRNQQIPTDVVIAWAKSHDDWGDLLRRSVRTPSQFEMLVNNMTHEMRSI
jgi:hypothetical protein